jgi:hypothetical protein
LVLALALPAVVSYRSIIISPAVGVCMACK